MLPPAEKPIFKSKNAHRAAVVGLSLITCAILYWGLESLYRSIKLPSGSGAGWDLYQKQQAALQLAALKTQDTDHDGLSDFDEQYVYGTSIYLEDTDSDGLNDKAELEQSSDPLCPQGQTCTAGIPENSVVQKSQIVQGQATPTEIRSILKGVGVDPTELDSLSDDEITKLYQETLAAMGQTTDSSSADTSTLTTEPTAQELRRQLAAAGADAATLESLDDATLLNMYRESLNSPDASDSGLTPTAADLSDLNADEIRALLLQAGLSADDLQGLDDATLKRIFLENLPAE